MPFERKKAFTNPDILHWEWCEREVHFAFGNSFVNYPTIFKCMMPKAENPLNVDAGVMS